MLKNVPVQFIIYCFWETNDLPELPLSYMNIVYKVTLAAKIEVDFSTKTEKLKMIEDDEGVLQGVIDV